MSGRQGGFSAAIIRGALRVAAIPYGMVVQRRNRGFDSGAKPIERVNVPVISVGNLTTGGTGKTPIVCYLAKWFRRSAIRVAIVSRGYGRGDQGENDEALELHERLPDVPHVQDADRVAGAALATEEFMSQLILLDDGFQHRRLHRDLDIVVIDATCPFGYDFLLPRGLLREPKSSLARADLIMVTRVGSVNAPVVDDIEQEIRCFQPKSPIIFSDHMPARLIEYPDTELDIERISGKRVAALSAIGNPDAFEDSLRRSGAEVTASKQLADHNPYSPETVAELRDWIHSLGTSIEFVVCTHKDLVKLATDRLGGQPLLALQIDLVITRGTEDLEAALESIQAMIADSDDDES
jgi:tetraacyldisaccharide 4'-kinase